jgi:hypothetical protein
MHSLDSDKCKHCGAIATVGPNLDGKPCPALTAMSLSLQQLEDTLYEMKKAKQGEPDTIEVPIHPSYIERYGEEAIREYAEKHGITLSQPPA